MKSQTRYLTFEWPGPALRRSLAALALCGAMGAAAQEYRELNVKKGTLVGDQYLAGATVDVHGRVEGDLTMAGLQAGLDGTVSGDVNAAGFLVHVGGVVGDDVRALGGKVIVQGWVGDGLLVAGGEIALTRGTRVGGDAILGGRRIVDLGDVDGDLHAAGAYVEIDGDVAGVARIHSDEVVIGPKARLRGDLVVTGAQPPRIAEGASDRREGVGGRSGPPHPGSLGGRRRAGGPDADRDAAPGVGLDGAGARAGAGRGRAGVEEPVVRRDAGHRGGRGTSHRLRAPRTHRGGDPGRHRDGIRLDPPRPGRLLLDGAVPGRLDATGGYADPRGTRALGERLLWTLLALFLLRGAAELPWVGWVVTVAAVLAGAGAVARAAQLARARGRVRPTTPGPAAGGV